MKSADLTQNRQLGMIAAIRTHAWYNADVRSIAILLLGFICVLLLVPPAHSFPITDDWAYAQSVTEILKGTYSPHDFVQPTALGHLMWGALFSLLFDQSFTTLAIANLAMSAACITIFYLLLRQVQITPQHALFGTALLALNPMYVYLSYSFMTDITFLAFMLSSCLCYIRGMQRYAQGVDRTAWLWLLVGGMMAALAYLTRQFGLLLLPAALGYLWWSRRWTWPRAAAIAAIPLTAFLLYMLWERTQPSRTVDLILSNAMQVAVKDPPEYMLKRLLSNVWIVPILGLSLLPLIRMPQRLFRALPLLTLILLFQMRSLQQHGSIFAWKGSIVDHTGFLMYNYEAAPLWTEPVWTVLGILLGVLVSLHLTAYGEQLYKWLRSRPWQQRAEEPVLMLYFLAVMLCFVTLIVSFFLFDRYLLPILPLLMVPELLRFSASNTNMRLGWRWVLALPVALFAIVGQRDYMAHAAARWQAAEQLISQGARHEQIDAGFEWAGWYSYEAGARYIREKQDFTHEAFPPNAIHDPVFAVSDSPHPGYAEIGSMSYASWLNGGQTRRVLLLKRK